MLGGTDAEQARVDIAVVDPPAQGTLSGTGPVLYYTSTPGYQGPDSFTFKVSDGELQSTSASVSINVPEPGRLLLLAVGSLFIAAVGRRR